MDAFMLGATIRKARKTKKLNQTELASMAGISRYTLGRLENGTVEDLGFRKLLRILDALELSLQVKPADAVPVMGENWWEDDAHA